MAADLAPSPSQSPARGQFIARVSQNAPLCQEHFLLTLLLPAFPPTAPGQFIQLSCRDLDAAPDDRELDWSPGHPLDRPNSDLAAPWAMLRRPFSLAGRRDLPDGSIELDVIHRIVGVGTDWLARRSPDDAVHLLGPLGNRFALPPASHLAVLIGGGVGIPPMLYLAEALAANGRRAVVFAGATSRDLLPLTIVSDTPPAPTDATPAPRLAEFSRYGFDSVVTTDDGSFGFRGFVTQALERYLDQLAHHNPRTAPAITLYTCGPEPMMRRAAELAMSRRMPCQVAVERAMACGMGTCQSCCIRVRKPDPAAPPLPGRDWCYRLACTDGPVFEAGDLLW